MTLLSLLNFIELPMNAFETLFRNDFRRKLAAEDRVFLQYTEETNLRSKFEVLTQNF